MTKESLSGVYGAGTKYPLGDGRLQYDRIGRRTRLAFKSENRTDYLNLSTSQTYAYDSNQRLTGLQREADAAQRVQYSYDTDGRVTKAAYGNGTSGVGSGARTEYNCDACGALTRLRHFKGLSGSYAEFERIEYSYDLGGNITKKYLNRGLDDEGTVTFLYDNLNRLTHEESSRVSSFSNASPRLEVNDLLPEGDCHQQGRCVSRHALSSHKFESSGLPVQTFRRRNGSAVPIPA